MRHDTTPRQVGDAHTLSIPTGEEMASVYFDQKDAPTDSGEPHEVYTD